MNVLVVDDAAAVRRILRSALEDLGMNVAEAEDGEEALAYLSAIPEIDLAIVDWNMPRMCGVDLIRRLRELPGRECVRVLMVTTEATSERVVEALSAGADEYLMKPFTIEAMIEKLALLGLLSTVREPLENHA